MRFIYNVYVTTIMVVAVGISGLAMAGYLDTPAAFITPQMGVVVQEHQPGNFNDEILLDTTQVEGR